jgi:hypothetical protein
MTSLRALILIVAATGVALGAASCGEVKKDRLGQALYSATTGYGQAIRWGYYDAAIAFLEPETREGFDPEALSNIRVTGYEVLQPAVISPEETAAQLVRIEYVLQDEQRVKTLSERQDWRWDKDDGAWWLHSGLPKFAR